jgi:UDP-glucose 4-epimerase
MPTQQSTGLKPLVITGARGYIGGALVQRLAGEGHALRLVSRSPASANGDAGANIEYIAADLSHEAGWEPLLKNAGAIIHLSSRTDLRAAELDPVGDRKLNVEPVRALVRAARHGRRSIPVIFASTVTIVGVAHANPVSEQTPDDPCSVYDRHKLESEMILREATREGVVNACSLRLSNVYGFGSGARSTNFNRGILNETMRRAMRGERFAIYGKGEYIRDFTFIGDVVDAFCRALSLERVRDGRHYVIASGSGSTLVQVFRLVAQEAARFTGRAAVEILHVPEPENLHPIERRNFVGDSSLFQKLTGWGPQVDLPRGIRDYLERIAAQSQPGGTEAV